MVGAIRLAGVDNAVQRTNCAFYFPEDNRYEYAAKIYPVPFGEEIPFKQIGWFHDLVEFYMPEGYEARLTAGEDVIKVFRLKTWTFAADICYEDTQASLNRRFRKAGAQFVVNLTNDGWFGETVELDQHLANSVFRTVENRFAMVRATNTGISAFVDPTGRIVAHIVDESGKYRRVAGTLTHRLMLDERRTVYTVVGDLFAWLTLGTAGALVLVRVVRRCMRMVRRS